tara:strand:+ start:8150 stop:9115 length:966 start_codon:yes stop_codon:yes gene_type:complete
MISFFLGVLILITFFIFHKYNLLIGKKIFLIDKTKKIPLLGGIFLIIGLFLNQFYQYYILKITHIDEVVFYFIVLMFFVALIDDLCNLSPLIRLILCSILIILVFLKSGFLIKTLNFKYLNLFLFPENIFITYFFSIFCMIVLIHAFNFVDGVNGLASLIGLSWLLYLSIKLPYLLSSNLVFLIFLTLFIYLNLKNKIYLGDSGNYIISSLIGILIIKENLNNPFTFYVEELFLLFLIPGIDFIRLFFVRIKNKKNPLHGDLNHLHHLLLKKYSLFKTLIIYLSLTIFPIFIFILYENLLIILLVVTILIYSFLVNKLKIK